MKVDPMAPWTLHQGSCSSWRRLCDGSVMTPDTSRYDSDRFMDSPAGLMVSVTSSTTSDVNRIHVTSCCGISVCAREAPLRL
ncbi:hypothetical protein TNCV_1883111 [Trichonephila clavipes]|nr:hypothetical protein TNCV_1883111 [Trichonephila clavipes]